MQYSGPILDLSNAATNEGTQVLCRAELAQNAGCGNTGP